MKSTVRIFFSLGVLGCVFSCRVQQSPPELTKLSVNQEYVDKPITLSGYQFGTDPIVTFGMAASAVNAPIGSHDETTIQVNVPRIAPGKTQVRVQTREGTSDPLPFRVLQPDPIITDIAPTNGLPGTQVVITGDYLNQLRRVRFNDIDAIINDSTTRKITITMPASVPRGPQPLAIETSTGSISKRFVVAGTPQITSISPVKAKPGTELLILGKNFTDGIVSINGLVTDKSLTTIKDTEIRTTIPPTATSGLVRVQVFETLIATSRDTLRLFDPPFITRLLAQDGAAGEKLIIEGRNLREITTVSIGSVSVPFRLLNDTQLEATIPALASSGPVAISATGIGGTATATDPFFFFLPPSNLVLNPTRQLKERQLIISGKDLYRITSVKVNGISTPINDRVEGVNLVIILPAGASSGPVTVSSRAGTASTPLVIVQKAVVTDVLPLKARPGDRVVLRGNYLLNAQILFTGSGTSAADGGKKDDQERWVLVPAEAQTGPLRVTNETNDVVTTAPLTVLRLISNIDFTPRSGKAGDEIVLTGQNMATVQEIRFSDGTSAAAKFVLNGSSVRVTIPAGATTGQICLINEAGRSCSSSTFTITP